MTNIPKLMLEGQGKEMNLVYHQYTNIWNNV